MNIEDYRDFCLSLGDDIEEKLLQELTRNSYEIVKAKYSKTRCSSTSRSAGGQ